MAKRRFLTFLDSHRSWEDWLGIGLGLVIIFAPWIANEFSNQAAVINAAVAGIVVLLLAELDLVRFRRWTEVGQLVCGAWVATSPLFFSYSGVGSLRVWHAVAGLLVLLLGALELWQLGDKTE